MTEKLTYKDFLISHYNLILKGIVAADVEMAKLESSSFILGGQTENIEEKAREMPKLRLFLEQQKKELKVVEKMLSENQL